MKKLILGAIVCLAFATPLYGLVQTLQAAPITDYSVVSPTVKIMSYKLARNQDLYKAAEASASLISPDGLLLTNSHAVLDERDDPYETFGICLTFNESEEPVCEYSAFLMAYDKNLDLALLTMSGYDNRGNLLTELPYYDYNYEGQVELGQVLTILGYSDIGGRTLTQTQGQVSGFEDQNGVKYIKTDTDFSAGNSGGAALDAGGNLVGVPTYLASSYENLGYVLDIKEGREFIESNLAAEPLVDLEAYNLLVGRLNLLNDTKDSNYYMHPKYPSFSLMANENWKWDDIDTNSVSLLSESNEGDKVINIAIEYSSYKIEDRHMAEALRISELYSDYLTNYQTEDIEFAGYPATLQTFNMYSEKQYQYLIPFGYSLVVIQYSVDLQNLEQDLPIYEQVIDSFAFLDLPDNNPQVIETYTNVNPDFSISRAGNWKIYANPHAWQKDKIVILENPDSIYGEINVSYSEIAEAEKILTNEQALEDLVTQYQWRQIINQNPSVKLDGLEGYAITYIGSGYEAEENNKVSEVYLRNGDYLYQISYEDKIDSYNQNLPYFKQILNSFKNYQQPAELIGRGENSFGSLDYTFPDITYHRYEEAISQMANKGVVYGYTDGSFRPEKTIMTDEVKSFIKNSLAESKRANIDESGYKFLLTGEAKLADVLKALVQTYQLNIWQDTRNDAPDWKPYMDKGYELSIIPYELVDPEHVLTRAEFTYILYQLLESFEM